MEPAPAPPPEGQNPAPAPSPVMDVVPPPPAEAASNNAKPDEKPTTKLAAIPKQPKPPKQRGNGVGLAIVATVIIVLGLAVLATYAFIQSHK